MFTKKMDVVMGEEFGDATLETEISLETGEVQWMRQGVVIQSGGRHLLAQDGRKRSLTIYNLTLSDRGTYRCETLHDRTQVKLNVERKLSINQQRPSISRDYSVASSLHCFASGKSSDADDVRARKEQYTL